MQVRRVFPCVICAVLVSALLGLFSMEAKAAPYDADFCRSVAMFDVVYQEWGKASITGAKARVAKVAKQQANDAREMFKKYMHITFDEYFDDRKKTDCTYTEIFNSQEILIQSNNPFRDSLFLSNFDEAKSVYSRWKMYAEKAPEPMTELKAGFYIQAIASPTRRNVEIFLAKSP